jgi:hypothetical protein
MAVFNASQLSALMVIQSAQRKLLALLSALNDLDDLYIWMSGQSDADLEAGLGFSPADLLAVKTGLADAHALVQLYKTGTLPGTYVLPYTFGASQRIVIQLAS